MGTGPEQTQWPFIKTVESGGEKRPGSFKLIGQGYTNLFQN
jgi:hypothetical protein